MPNLKLPRLSLKSTAKSSIALHLTPSRIRLLGLKKKDKSPLFSEELLSKENKAKALMDLVNKHNIKGQEVIACLSVNDGLMKFYTYPSTLSKKDLKNSIEWAIKREILTLKEELYYDYYVLDSFPDPKKVGVVAVMARKETIEGVKKLVESTGLKLKTLDYEVVAIINYGLYHKLPLPFSILHVDYDYSILVTYSSSSISYYVDQWSLAEYLENRNEEALESFTSEIMNLVVLNDITSLYIAGPVLLYEDVVARIMENVPIFGLLDLEGIPSSFLIPYSLCIRGLEE
ncbi:MAG: type IV pilus biogenesis protein PilM [Aquificaceae bacterium]